MSESSLREIYVSTDIETDGPVAGKHSMLRIGSAAYLAEKELVGTFSANLGLKAFGGRPVFVGYPAAFDFSFVYWYLAEFAGGEPIRLFGN